jgi:polyphosphate kinase
VSDATERRPYNPAVRVEVERSMPRAVGELVLENLRREAAGRADSAVVGEVSVVHGLLDLRCLADLPLPDDPSLTYPPLAVRSSMDADRPVIDQIADGDILVHHPFDDYESTVVRFLREAAADPQVTTIKITLYRAGDPSAVVDALLATAHAGKKVRGAGRAQGAIRRGAQRRLGARARDGGAHVVYGFVGLKVHAKIALVVRREGSTLRRYAHVARGTTTKPKGRFLGSAAIQPGPQPPVLSLGGAHLRRRRPVFKPAAHGLVASPPDRGPTAQ